MRLLFVLLLCAPAWAAPAATDADVLIQPHGECHSAYYASWKLKGEVKISRVLGALSDLDCEHFFVPRSLLDTKVDIDIGDEEMNLHELRERLRGALRAKGFELDYVSASRLRRSSDDRPYAPLLAAPATVPPDPELDKGIHCVDHKCTITRALFDRMLANTPELARSARFVPSIRNGKPNGFKLYAIRPSGVFARLGFQNGDTIKSVNGFDLSTPDSALEVYTNISRAGSLSVAVERRGVPLTLDYVVK